MAPRETENNAHAKFWGDKERALWYVVVFSGVVNSKSDKPLLTPVTADNLRPLCLFFCLNSHTSSLPSVRLIFFCHFVLALSCLHS